MGFKIGDRVKIKDNYLKKWIKGWLVIHPYTYEEYINHYGRVFTITSIGDGPIYVDGVTMKYKSQIMILEEALELSPTKELI